MLRTLLPALLCALAAAPAAAQEKDSAASGGFRSAKEVAPAAPSKRPAAGVRSIARDKHEGEGSVEADKVAALRAQFEAAKASGKICAERLAHMEARLLALEAGVHVWTTPVRPKGGFRSIKDK